jgi:apolipoprotein D and lipocalin family protein
MATSYTIQLLISVMMLVSCTGVGSRNPLPTATSVDLTRYAGTWYEIARLPMWFQRNCLDSKAIYTIRQDGKVGVHNDVSPIAVKRSRQMV